MDVLIRQQDANDRSVSASAINIGSDPDQDIRLGGEGVLANHANIKASRNGIQISCSRGATFQIDGESQNKRDLAVGDSININGNVVTVIEAPTGFDVGLEVVPLKGAAASVASAYKTDLTHTRLGPRKISWPLAIGTLLISMLIPLAYFFMNSSDSQTVAKLPITDAVWTSGPLHEAHATLETNCNACHKKLFQKVTNESCEDCHSGTLDHIVTVAQNEQFGFEMNGRCAACHKEHNEPISTLVDTANKLCTDCHSEHELVASAIDNGGDRVLGKVGDFTDDAHPEFTVMLQSPPEGAEYDLDAKWVRSRVTLPNDVENSQLKFNHEIHYASNKVLDESNNQLECAYCHTLDVDGEHFDSISYEMNCASSSCHDLALDARNRLPHGYPDIVVAAVEGFYLRKFGNADGPVDENRPARKEKRRRLEEVGSGKECTGSPYECALELAAGKIDQQFTKTGCVTCHTINDNGSDSNLDRFQVATVKLTEDYHPTAKFDHLSHGILLEPGEKEAIRGEEACMYCHDASKSVVSSDILMPKLDSCTVCHDGQKVANNVPLGCTQCHAYHPPSHIGMNGEQAAFEHSRDDYRMLANMTGTGDDSKTTLQALTKHLSAVDSQKNLEK